MGSPANEPSRSFTVENQHRVTLSSFFMSIYPVTVGEFRRFVDATNYRTDAERSGGARLVVNNVWTQRSDANWMNPYFTQTDTHPVVLVSLFDAIEYCNWLSQQEGLTPVYTISGTGSLRGVIWNRNANGYRLPTEAEWEYACRAGTTTAYNTGVSITTAQANINNAIRSTTPVGSYPANAWGLYDMHGNVYEMCWDIYAIYPSTAQTDPTGPSSNSLRIMRGGGWETSIGSVRTARRGTYNPTSQNVTIGFRVVRNVPGTVYTPAEVR
jgi:formylglycine-generating enzyme required for sulfatase activity